MHGLQGHICLPKISEPAKGSLPWRGDISGGHWRMSNFQIGRENTSVHSLTCHPKVVPVTYSGTKRPGSRDVRSLGEKLFQLESFISFYWPHSCKLHDLVMTEKPGVLQFMGSQRVRHHWATELNWPCCAAFGILIPWPEIKPGPRTVKALSPNHWTTKEFPANF